MQQRSASIAAPEKIHALTSLRFFAALYVVLFHTLPSTFPSLVQNQIFANIMYRGHVSVSFFFLLSGYILAVVYLKPGKTVNNRSFWVARFARVYPLFFLTLVADTPFLFLQRLHQYGFGSAIAKTSVTFLGTAAMLQAWVTAFKGINNPNWSLSVETFFYLTFPFVGVALWKLKGTRLWLTAFSIWVVSLGAVYFCVSWMLIVSVLQNPALHLGTFCLGILLARWQALEQQKQGISPRTNTTIALALLAALALFVSAAEFLPPVFVPYLNNGMLAPVFMLVVWAFSANHGLPAKVISPKWLVVLGEASFGLYLIHVPVDHVFMALHLSGNKVAYPFYLGTCIGLSVLSFYFVETPTRRWILRKLKTRTKETMEMASDAQ